MTRVLVTGGAGFVGASLPRPRAGATPTGRSSRSTTSTGGARSSTAAAREAGVDFAHGDVREPPTGGARPVRRARRVLGRAVGDGRPRRRRPTTSCRRTWSAPTTASSWPRRETRSSSSCRRAASTRSRARALAFRRPRRASSSTPRSRSPGVSERGVAEDFPLDRARTLYGATKLSAELLFAEYAERVRRRAVVNRCGVVAGPGRWARSIRACSRTGSSPISSARPLRYIGYGGQANRCATCSTSTTSSTSSRSSWPNPDRWAGRPSTSEAAGGQPVAPRNHRALPRAHGARVEIATCRETRRATSRSTSRTAGALQPHRVAAARRTLDDPGGHHDLDPPNERAV